MRRAALAGLALSALVCVALPPRRLAAQTEGAIEGRVEERGTDRSLGAVQVLVDDRAGAVTDTSGWYRVRGVRTGWHRVAARLIGFRGDSARQRLRPGGRHDPAGLRALGERGRAGAARGHRADRRAARSAGHEHRAEDQRRGPAGPAGELARGGDRAERGERWGRAIGAAGSARSRSFSTGSASRTSSTPPTAASACHIPPDLLGEASLVTNGFSARYGQALSGLVNVVTRDPGDAWEGRAAIETDRPFGGSLDHGLDRAAVRAGGPIAGGVGIVAAIDVAGRLDDDPVNAPPPDRSRSTRAPSSRVSCPTTAASNGTVPPSWWSRSPARRCSGSSASTPRISGCSTTTPTSTPSISRRRSGSGATS